MRLGIGIGWRPEIDLTVERLPGVDFVGVLAENVRPDPLPESLTVLRARGVPVIAHAVSLSLGGVEPVDRTRVAHLAAVASSVDAPLVSEHVAFTRAGSTRGTCCRCRWRWRTSRRCSTGRTTS